MARMRRPIGILIVGALLFLSGLIQIISGGALFLGSTGAVSGFAVIAVVIGLITLALGYGALQGWGWIWTLTMVIMVISVIIGAVNLLGGAIGTTSGLGGVGGILIPLIILLYMNTRGVRAWFGKVKTLPSRA
jgi:hypothetical protein